MSAPVSRMHEQNHTAQLAAQFNEFYLQVTLPTMPQIGNYRIIEEIGEGAFGKAYLAKHVLLDVQVVLKCGLVDDPNIVREIYYHRQLRHKNIVNLYEVIKTETHLWMVLEYCEGSELFYYIYEKRALDLDVCKQLFYQIVEAIRYVHLLNLSHRDLKLENILLADKRRTIVKLSDFGFVREFNPYKRLFLSTVCGTTAYMAPEVLKNEKYSGFSIDIWALGIILYAMAYGELPFDEDDELKTKYKILNEEPNFRDSVPAEINQLLVRMLSKDPAGRPGISEISNLPFLIDTTNKMMERKPSVNDADSIISINQHYKVNSVPFQSRIERNLLKKMEKLNMDVDALQSAVYAGQANLLTAFYDLLLASEFKKKKRRYLRKKRYYETKRQLKKSRKRIRSALSLSEQGSTSNQPLEKVMSSLSLTSRHNSSRNNLARRSTEEYRRNARNSFRQLRSGMPSSLNGVPVLESNSVLAPLERQVSFYPDDGRSSASMATAESPKNRKRMILDKLQFWKRRRDDEKPLQLEPSDDSSSQLEIEVRRTPTPEKIPEPQPAETPEFIKVTDPPNGHKREDSKNTIPLHVSSDTAAMQLSISGDSYYRRPRPELLVLQVSQYSQLSQIYESEFDALEGTDDEDFFDDELSVNTSQYDLHHRVMLSLSTKRKKRPANFRVPSDTLILLASTTATRKRYPLSQVLSNSSDESSARLRIAERFSDDAGPPLRPISPRTNTKRPTHPKLRGLRSGSLSKIAQAKTTPKVLTTPMPQYPQANGSIPRSHSPPFNKKFHKRVIKPLVMGGGDQDSPHPNTAFKWPEDKENGTNTPRLYERKFTLGEVEEEDEEELLKMLSDLKLGELAMTEKDTEGASLVTDREDTEMENWERERTAEPEPDTKGKPAIVLSGQDNEVLHKLASADAQSHQNGHMNGVA